MRNIFRLTVEGMGPYQIAKRLTEEKIEKPSYYQATRQRGNFKTMCDFETPYNWTGGSVVRILERPEYMGDTVKQLILETIRYALKSVRMDEAAFIKSMRSASEVRDKSEVKS